MSKPLFNLARGRPVLAVFELCLRCNSACGYCDLPLNLGRYEMTRIVSEMNRHDVTDVLHFARSRGFVPVVGAYHWGVERYGKTAPELQYDRDAGASVFEDVLRSRLVPAGYFRNYVRDNIRWLRGDGLPPCDAGRYSVAIDASGNVAPCLALAHAGNLLNDPLETILARMDGGAIARCSERASCNMLCSRVVGSALRHPLAALAAMRPPARETKVDAP
ncbi:MAG: hypothetical protein GWN84_02905 [Gammaproteobacteria bacterium]|nr:hypothetical protein [Gammaproteobacteria bacterium]NIR82097.1 hypothetical protein [Gammaproteobacteria bacterium]NIR89330.1 hypothetical protein [Gammaproteobacteria bacterium]NIU03207.1 hypothetical protein [Gammaproteobacteria bacterium]NIV74502.1 hypothetical protein [Gammaproteobacteria bacterium]